MPIKSDREYRAFEVRAEDEKRVQGYATTFNSAYTLYTDDEFELREIINENAFDECDLTDVIMQYNHEGRVFARNTNGTLKIDIDNRNLQYYNIRWYFFQYGAKNPFLKFNYKESKINVKRLPFLDRAGDLCYNVVYHIM
jgi:hypothetical protein